MAPPPKGLINCLQCLRSLGHGCAGADKMVPPQKCLRDSLSLRRLYFDGACKHNLGGMGGAGWVVKNLVGENEIQNCKFVGVETTSDVAEYTACIEGLKAALDKDIRVLIAYGDSAHVCRQLSGAYGPVKENNKMYPFYKEATDLKKEFEIFSTTHIGRDLNQEADELANKAITDFVRRSKQN